MPAKTKMDDQYKNTQAPNTVFTPDQQMTGGSSSQPQTFQQPAAPTQTIPEPPIIPSENSLENTPTQTVESTTSTAAPGTVAGTPVPHKPRFRFNKVFFVIVGLAVLILVAVLVAARIISQRETAQLQSPSASINEQGVSLGAATDDSRSALQLQGSDNRLIVNGDVIVNGRLGISSNDFFGQVVVATLSANREYTLPDSSGTICLDSNNCNFLQGGATSSPIFGNVAATVLTQGGNEVCDSSNNCDFAGATNAFIQNGNSFGTTAILGTNDAQSLAFETNGNRQVTITTGGAVLLQNSTNSTDAFSIKNAAGDTTVMQVDTVNNYIRMGAFLDAGNANTTTYNTCNTIFGLVPCNATLDYEAAYVNPTNTAHGIYNVLGITANVAANTSTNTGVTNLIGAIGNQNFSQITANYSAALNATTGAMALIQGVSGVVLQGAGAGTAVVANGVAGSVDSRANITEANALIGSITNTNGVTITEANGANIAIDNEGTITALAGLRVSADNSGTITNSYGILLETPDNTGTFTNLYGLYVQDQSGIGSTNSVNIYSAGEDSQNYFEGHSAFGVDASVSDGSVVYIADTFTPTTIDVYGSRSEIILNPSIDMSSADAIASYGKVTVDGSNSYDIDGSYYGVWGESVHGGGGSIGTAGGVRGDSHIQGGDAIEGNGVSGIAWNDGVGNHVTRLYAVTGRVIQTATGTVDAAAALHAGGADNGEGFGTITKNYGLLVDAQSVGVENFGAAIGNSSTMTLWLSHNIDDTTSNGGIAFGASRDTNLYRSAAGTLTTDDDFTVGSQIAVGNSAAITNGVVATFVGTYTDTNGAVMGSYNGVTLDPSGASSANSYGSISALETEAANANNYTGFSYGSNSLITHNGSGTMDFAFANGGAVDNAGSGNITIAYGGTGVVINSGSGDIGFVAAGLTGSVLNTGLGDIASAAALFAVSATNSGGGAIASNNGLYVQAQTAGTEDFGIRVDTADTQTLWIGGTVAGDAGTSNTGIAFGSARDVNLYRGGSNTLKTDDDFFIDSANLGVGGNPGSYRLFVNDNNGSQYIASFSNDGNNAANGGIRIQAGADDGSGTTYYLDAYDGDGTQIGYIANTSGTFALTDISDARTKTNIANSAIDASSILEGLRVVDFNRIQNPDGPLITGFIAQEVQDIYGQAVTSASNGYLGISKDAFIPVLVKGHQNQQSELEVLNNKVTALQQQFNGINSNEESNTSDANFTSINVSGPTKLQQLTVVGSASIAQLTVTGNAHIAGDIRIGGHVLGNADTRGSLTVPAGEVSFRYAYAKHYTDSSQPTVLLTPKNTFAPGYRVESDNTGFTVYFQNPSASEVVMNYQVQE